MRFEPQPFDTIQIDGKTLEVMQHPHPSLQAQRFSFAQEGRKAIVYQLRYTSGKQLFALKVFKPKYRGPYIITNSERIAQYANLPGMSSCNRVIIKKPTDRDLINQYPELEYAVLMPWVGTRSWRDIVFLSRKLTYGQGILLALHTAYLLTYLEKQGVAHCDIAGSNVMVNIDQQVTYLVDLEDMYDPQSSAPSNFPLGTAGYQHISNLKNDTGQWVAEGDRFSAAVLFAEMLTWHKSQIRDSARGEHYFNENDMQDVSSDQYLHMLSALNTISPEIADLFAKAWSSPTLADCPSLDDWADSITRHAEKEYLPSVLESAISFNRDRFILGIWQRQKSSLNSGAVNEKQRQRIDLAKRRINALNALEKALTVRRIDHIIDIYKEHKLLLDPCQDFSVEDRRQVGEAQAAWHDLQGALQGNNDAIIEITWLHYESDWDWLKSLKKTEIDRVQLARKRMEILTLFQEAKRMHSDVEIAKIYNNNKLILTGFKQAYSDPRIILAIERADALEEFRGTTSDDALWKYYREKYALLDPCQDFSTLDRERVATVRIQISQKKYTLLQNALWSDKDLSIQEAYDPDDFKEPALFSPDKFTVEEKSRADLAVERMVAMKDLQSAMQSNDPVLIMKVYDSHELLLRRCSEFKAKDRHLIRNVRQKVLQARIADACKKQNDKEITLVADDAIYYGFELDAAFFATVREARKRLAAL